MRNDTNLTIDQSSPIAVADRGLEPCRCARNSRPRPGFTTHPFQPQPPKRHDARLQPVAHATIGVEHLLARTPHGGRIDGRPVVHFDRQRAREFERLVVRFRRQADDQIEKPSSPRDPRRSAVCSRCRCRSRPSLRRRRDRFRAFVRRPKRNRRLAEKCAERLGHRRAHRIKGAGKQRPTSARFALRMPPRSSALPVQGAVR